VIWAYRMVGIYNGVAALETLGRLVLRCICLTYHAGKIGGFCFRRYCISIDLLAYETSNKAGYTP